MAFVELGDSRISKSIFASQLNDSPTLSQDWLTQIKVGNLYIKPKLLTTANHGTFQNISCDYGVCLLNTFEAKIIKKMK